MHICKANEAVIILLKFGTAVIFKLSLWLLKYFEIKLL